MIHAPVDRAKSTRNAADKLQIVITYILSSTPIDKESNSGTLSINGGIVRPEVITTLKWRYTYEKYSK